MAVAELSRDRYDTALKNLKYLARCKESLPISLHKDIYIFISLLVS